MNQSLFIDKFKIDNHSPVFIIAELSANHNGSFENAKATIMAAKRAGANAIKLQTYTADTITLNLKTEEFKVNQGSIWDGKYLYDLYKDAYTPWEWHEQLFKIAQEQGLTCFSSPFDKTAVDFLETLNTPAYKIASFEITDIPLIEYVASKGKPVIFSTGIANLEDIELAINVCKQEHNDKVILLKCTSSYPAPIEDANLLVMTDMAKRFDVLTGLSDHTIGITLPIVATAMGARVIEKHFILDHSIGGPDAAFSLTEEEFTMMVKCIRESEMAIGKIEYTLPAKFLKNRELSRSIYVVKDIQKGEIISEKNIRSIRPGFGLHPKYFREVLGKKAKIDLRLGMGLQWAFIE